MLWKISIQLVDNYYWNNFRNEAVLSFFAPKPFPLATANYQIKLDQFEGPFDLLLFFIERDELDIYNIPITKIINDFWILFTKERSWT